MPDIALSTGFDASQIAMIGMALLILTMVMISTQRRLRSSQHMPQPSMRERMRENDQQVHAREGLEQVMLELDQLCRQLHGRLDTKIARLEAVIRDADRRIETLGHLVKSGGGAVGSTTLDVTLESFDPHEAEGPAAIGSGKQANVYRLADDGLAAVEIARQTAIPTGEVELMLSLRKARSSRRDASESARN
jgi:hypothetical protein